MKSFEAYAIKALLDGRLDIVAGLKSDYFTDKYKRIYMLCLEFFEQHKKLPSSDELIAIIEVKAPVQVKSVYQALVTGLQNIEDSPDIAVILSGLTEQHVLRNVDSDIEELVLASRDRDVTKVKNLLNKLNNQVNLNGIEIMDIADVKDMTDDHPTARSFLPKDHEDEFLGGGHTGLTIISGGTGGGKTVALLQAAANNYLDGKNVLFITLELPKSVLYKRLMSSVSGIEFGKILNNTLTPDEQKELDKIHNEMFNPNNTNYFKIIDETIDDLQLLNIIAVEAQLRQLDVVVLDYIQLVEINSSGDDWRGLSHLAKKLHKLTRTYGVTVITAAQINSEGKEKGTIMPKITARGSRELEFSSSQFLHLEPEPESGGLIMFSKKNRMAECKHLILEKDFKHMRIESTGLALN